jgi:hypothetical protein
VGSIGRPKAALDDLVADPRSDDAFDHERVLVLVAVDVGRDQSPRLDRVLDDREVTASLRGVDLELDAERRTS